MYASRDAPQDPTWHPPGPNSLQCVKIHDIKQEPWSDVSRQFAFYLLGLAGFPHANSRT